MDNSSNSDNSRHKSRPRKYSFRLKDCAAHLRLDQAIGRYVADLSREKAKKLIQIGAVWLNGTRIQVLSRKVVAGDSVTVYIGREGWEKYYEIDPDNILHEDEWLICYRKEAGIPTQGTICDNYNNLYSALIRYLKQKNPTPYLGAHHRLDMGTSGVVIFTTSKKINKSIHCQFKSGRVKKTYLALVKGNPKFRQKTVTTYIKKNAGKYVCSSEGPGKVSTTIFTSETDFSGYSLLRAEPQTGRTHQIRLQLAFLGLPILGDRLYGERDDPVFARTMLHAQSLTIFHPIHRKDLTITADLFDDMKQHITA